MYSFCKFLLQISIFRLKQLKVMLLRWKKQELKSLHWAPSLPKRPLSLLSWTQAQWNSWRPLAIWGSLVKINGKCACEAKWAQENPTQAPQGLRLFSAAPTPWGMGNFTSLRIAPLGTQPFPFHFSTGSFWHRICFITPFGVQSYFTGGGELYVVIKNLGSRIWLPEFKSRL